MTTDGNVRPDRAPQQYDAIWRHTHRDYKGLIAGKRSILVFRDGTTIVPLAELTDAEFLDALATAQRRATRSAQ